MADTVGITHLVITAVSTLFSGLIGGWLAASKAARRQQKTEDDLSVVQRDVASAARKAEVEERLGEIREETAKAAHKEELKEAVAQVQASLAKAAGIAEVEQLVSAERAGRERIHREIDTISARLSSGDARFDVQMIELTKLAGSLAGTANELKAFQGALSGLVTKELCGQKHGDMERRLEIIEGHRRREVANA